MEIWNDIWNAISVPNESLMSILLFFACIAESTVTMYFILVILNPKPAPTMREKILFVAINTFLSHFVINMWIPQPFNYFANYISIITFSCILFKAPLLKSAAALIADLVAVTLATVAILKPYLNVLNITSEQLTTIPMYRGFYMILVFSLVFLCGFIIKHSHPSLNLRFWKATDARNKRIIFINLLAGITVIIIQSMIIFYYIDRLPSLSLFLSFVAFILYFGISIYSLTRVFKLISTTQRLESTEEYNHPLRILHDNLRSFKHDFDNIITTIDGYIKTEDMEGLKKYHLQLVGDCQRVNNYYILNPDVVNNNGIYNLLTKKYYEAESRGIRVKITFLLDLNSLHMKIYDFAKILGILTDNAIEASAECDEKIIHMTFRNEPDSGRQLLIIQNTCADKKIDTEKIYTKGISDKEGHMGLGLWEIRKLIKKIPNINLKTSADGQFFTQQLEIYPL